MSASQRTKGADDYDCEVWADIAGCNGDFLGRYQVSNLGRVRAHPDVRIGGSKPGRVLYQSKDERGYPQVFLHYAPMKKRTVKVHRLVAEAFLSERPAGFQVNHIDGVKENNRVENLEYVSNLQNSRHAFRVIRLDFAVVVKGQPMSVPEAVERFAAPGVHAGMVKRRIARLGWSIEAALNTPPLPTGAPPKESRYARK